MGGGGLSAGYGMRRFRDLLRKRAQAKANAPSRQRANVIAFDNAPDLLQAKHCACAARIPEVTQGLAWMAPTDNGARATFRSADDDEDHISTPCIIYARTRIKVSAWGWIWAPWGALFDCVWK